MIEMNDVHDYNDFECNYLVDLSEIDLDMVSEKNIEDAMRSCGWEGMDQDNPEYQVEMLHSYGCKAPIEDWSGNNWHKMFREARKLSYELDDLESHEERMNRPVNALGSTAREFMQGDFRSGMLRGISEGKDDARIIGKMHGMSDDLMDKMRGMETKFNAGQFRMHPIGGPSSVPSDDPLPYTMGFMAGMNSSKMEDNREDLAPAYIEGYKFGVSVRCGDNPWPDWAK
ncbi:hypothetical protein DRQ25_16440 [Candidatus Fermentibacteria bacterium]|nr:MAG: hypothetical protein DRQ25_16440 [Candidatus Fermentibacteria bacterium]